MRSLYLSTVDQDYRQDYDSVLGPWSFASVENDYPNWQDMSFLNAFDSAAAVSQASQECADLTGYMVAQWANKLNALNGVDYKTKFWSPLITRWVFHSTSAAWRRWNLVKQFIEKNREKSFKVSIITPAIQKKWQFTGLAEFIDLGLLSPEYDLWLYSLIIERLAPSDWVIEKADTSKLCSTKQFLPQQLPVSTNIAKRLGRRLLGRLPFSDIPGVNPAWTIVFSTFLQIIPKKTRTKYYFFDFPNPPLNVPVEFLDMLDIILENTVLQSVTKRFYENNKRAQKHKYVAGRLFINAASHSNEEANFQAAHAINAGEAFTRAQHGASYGTMAHSHVKKLTEYTMSAFLTWGWKSQNNLQGKFVALPSPLLSKIRNRHRPLNANIILVGTKTWLRSQRIDYTPDPSYTPLYRKEKIKFISALDPEIMKNFYYRPYLRSQGELADKEYVLKYFPMLKTIDGSLERPMLGCRVLVLDHPGTTLNMSMAANVPTICFWNDNTWPLSPEATPYFDNLRRVGILFSEGTSAATKINENFNDLQSWWNSPEVQSARKAWADHYAHSSKIWWWYWFRELWRL